MVNDFFTMPLGIVNLFTNRRPNISINVQNINAITYINFMVMCKFKGMQFLGCWFRPNYRINTLQNIVPLLCLKVIGNFLHFFFKAHTSA